MFQSQRSCLSYKKILEFELLMSEIQEEVFPSPAVVLEQICNGRQVILGYSWVRRWLDFGSGNPWR